MSSSMAPPAADGSGRGGAPRTTGAGLWAGLAGGLVLALMVCCAGGVVLVRATAGGDSAVLAPGPDDGSPVLEIGVDLPYQGTLNGEVSQDTYRALGVYLAMIGGKVGGYRIALRRYDYSREGARGQYDERLCVRNAEQHVRNAAEVAVIGTFHVRCTTAELPVLSEAGMLMVSHAHTYPGLTRVWADAEEPDMYHPSGPRNFARVMPTDQGQGAALAWYAGQRLGRKRCWVLIDSTDFSRGMASSFANWTGTFGVVAVGVGDTWISETGDYVNPFPYGDAGVDCVVAIGSFENFGDRLVHDKVAWFGSNDKVPFLTTDWFMGYPRFRELPEAEGTVMSTAGLGSGTIRANSRAAQDLAAAFRRTYGYDLQNPYAYYGVQALQVILAAIERSDGTRESIRSVVLEDDGDGDGLGGVAIGAGRTILGEDLYVRTNGDTNVQQYELYQVTGGQEVAHDQVTFS